LLALMHANPGASVTKILKLSARPRNSARLSLERLEKAGRVEHAGRGQLAVVEAPTPKPAWLEPVSGKRVARHAADGQARDELTTP
jgi:hypothetical protein